MTIAYVGLGANLGDARQTLRDAIQALHHLPDTQLLAHSSFYRSAPVEAQGPDYINAVAKLDTRLPPYRLLEQLQALESHHGRLRPYPNAPRTLDLDVLLYGSISMNDPVLTIPHPKMHLRAFVLMPLHELETNLRLEQGDVWELLQQCSDQAIVREPTRDVPV